MTEAPISHHQSLIPDIPHESMESEALETGQERHTPQRDEKYIVIQENPSPDRTTHAQNK